MSFFNARPSRRPRRFEQVEQDDGKRVHFHRLSPYRRDRGRSLLWLLVMLAFVSYLIYYLNHVKG